MQIAWDLVMRMLRKRPKRTAKNSMALKKAGRLKNVWDVQVVAMSNKRTLLRIQSSGSLASCAAKINALVAKKTALSNCAKKLAVRRWISHNASLAALVAAIPWSTARRMVSAA
jgi:hypothetical protein